MALLTVKLVAITPLKVNAVAPVNPVPVTVTEAPTGPEPGVNPVMVGAGGATKIASVAVPVPLTLLAKIVTEALVATVGVPVMVPSVVLMLKPAGRLLAPKLVGELLAVML